MQDSTLSQQEASDDEDDRDYEVEEDAEEEEEEEDEEEEDDEEDEDEEEEEEEEIDEPEADDSKYPAIVTSTRPPLSRGKKVSQKKTNIGEAAHSSSGSQGPKKGKVNKQVVKKKDAKPVQKPIQGKKRANGGDEGLRGGKGASVKRGKTSVLAPAAAAAGAAAVARASVAAEGVVAVDGPVAGTSADEMSSTYQGEGEKFQKILKDYSDQSKDINNHVYYEGFIGGDFNVKLSKWLKNDKFYVQIRKPPQAGISLSSDCISGLKSTISDISEVLTKLEKSGVKKRD